MFGNCEGRIAEIQFYACGEMDEGVIGMSEGAVQAKSGGIWPIVANGCYADQGVTSSGFRWDHYIMGSRICQYNKSICYCFCKMFLL